MKRVEFTLSMPGNNAWNGRWSGEGKHYAIVRTLADKTAVQLDGKHWDYSFGDGWRAAVDARVLAPREKAKASAGFAGYDWMVASILSDGDIYGPARPKPAA